MVSLDNLYCFSVALSCLALLSLCTAAPLASLSLTISQSLLKLMFIKSVMPSNHPFLCCPLSSCLQSFPATGSFLMSRLFASGGQSIGASASVVPMTIQGWFPLGLTGLISLLSKGLSKSFLQHHSLNASVLQCSPFLLSSSHIHTWLQEKKKLALTISILNLKPKFNFIQSLMLNLVCSFYRWFTLEAVSRVDRKVYDYSPILLLF